MKKAQPIEGEHVVTTTGGGFGGNAPKEEPDPVVVAAQAKYVEANPQPTAASGD